MKELNEGWELQKQGDASFISADVPGCVHTALLKNGEIEDPFYRLNEHDLQWIDKEDWVYQNEFPVNSDIFNKEHIRIKFKGLDTYADVFLNDQLILEADNMFREWTVDIKDYVKKGKNSLKIIFKSPIKVGIEKYDALPYQIPVSDNDLAEIGKVPGNKKVSIFTRKAGYHFGWDWGPRLVSSGIWKPVYLEAWDNARISSMHIIQHNLNAKEAQLKARVDIESDELKEGTIVLKVDDEVVEKRQLTVDRAALTAEIPFIIKNPELWWPNGMGAQHLYKFTVELYSNEKLLHTQDTRIGLRTIELVTDADEFGNTFHFKVNGRPMFMKGANYIPQDSFLDRVHPEKYEHVIQSAVDANMNMLRVWGGGIYEKDIFYELCDEKGLLVWQDFMFACSMYPGDEAFLENVMQEAIDNVKRLRNHPSVALWCGNNENLSAWYRWGWKERVIEEQGQEVADILWKAYQDVFHKILPEVVEKYDGNRDYWASSSSASMGVPDNLTSGDLHYWGVWWGKEPFSSFRKNMGRFMSEYGFQSFPEMKTIKEYTIESDWDIYSEVMKSHQRSSIGNETIELYMERDYHVPEKFQDFIYVGQVLQGEGIKRAIEIHRVGMPYCMGSLYWQINDCWPVASWSGMDYFGRWKALHYMAKDAFKNVIIVPESDGSKTFVQVVSDLPEAFEAQIKLRLLSFEGEVLWEESLQADIPPNRSSQLFSVEDKNLPGELNARVFEASLLKKGKIIDRRFWYYAPPNKLNLSDPHINYSTSRLDNGDVEISLSTNTLAKNVFLEFPVADGTFSQNYFDMIPGEDYKVIFHPSGDDQSVDDITIKSLAETY